MTAFTQLLNDDTILFSGGAGWGTDFWGYVDGCNDPLPPTHSEKATLRAQRDYYRTAAAALRGELETALAASLKLQSHYAGILNMYDGGNRILFENVNQWLERLRKTGTLPNEVTK